jgi:hypothetical protein
MNKEDVLNKILQKHGNVKLLLNDFVKRQFNMILFNTIDGEYTIFVDIINITAQQLCEMALIKPLLLSDICSIEDLKPYSIKVIANLSDNPEDDIDYVAVYYDDDRLVSFFREV